MSCPDMERIESKRFLVNAPHGNKPLCNLPCRSHEWLPLLPFPHQKWNKQPHATGCNPARAAAISVGAISSLARHKESARNARRV